MGIVVIGAVFVDIKGFPLDAYIPTGRNAGHIKYIHGGVSRNVVEDIANIELRPTFLSIVDDSALGEDVIRKLQRHKVNTEYVQKIPEGMGTWLAVFDNDGDLAGSISQRPNLMPILDLINEKGDEIFKDCDSIVLEADIDPEIIKTVLDYSKKRNLAGRFQARQNAHCVRAEYPVRKIQMPSGVPSPALPSDPRLRNRLQLRFLFA